MKFDTASSPSFLLSCRSWYSALLSSTLECNHLSTLSRIQWLMLLVTPASLSPWKRWVRTTINPLGLFECCLSSPNLHLTSLTLMQSLNPIKTRIPVLLATDLKNAWAFCRKASLFRPECDHFPPLCTCLTSISTCLPVRANGGSLIIIGAHLNSPPLRLFCSTDSPGQRKIKHTLVSF